MTELKLSYEKWKALTQSGSLACAHRVTGRTNRLHVWSGNQVTIFSAIVDADDYSDWATNFQSVSILVDRDAEASAKLIEAAGGGQVQNTNEVSVTVAPSDVDGSVPGMNIRYETAGSVRLNEYTKDWLSVYEITEPSIFYKMVFHLDSDNICMRVIVDGSDLFTSDGIVFENLEDLYLSTSKGSYGSGASGVEFGLYQYNNNAWLWIPPVPLKVGSSLVIQMRASDNNSKRDFNRGIAIRRVIS